MAKAVINDMRGMHPVYVFTYRGRHVKKCTVRHGATLVKELAYPKFEFTI